MEQEDEILGAVCILLIVAGIEQIRRQRRRRTVWVRSWLERREQPGAYHALLQELATEDPCNLKNFLRMDMESFNELLHMVESLIQRRDTHMRNAIPPAERLALTLRFLATGENYQSLQYLYRISRSSISKIIPETCEAIYTVLKDKFRKVSEYHKMVLLPIGSRETPDALVQYLHCNFQNLNSERLIMSFSPENPSRIHNVAKHEETPRIYYLHIQSDIKFRFTTTLVTSKVVNPSAVAKETVFDVTLPDEAFISDFVMEIDGRLYPGQVDEKEKAKQQYEKAKKKGQSAGQVSQRPRETNRFKVEVNVAAQSKVTFNLTYQELLYRHLGSYEHVIYIQPGQIVDDLRIDVSIQESRDITNLIVPPLRNDILTESTNISARNELAIIERPTSKSARIQYYPSVEDQRARSEQGISGLFVVEYDVARRVDAGDILVVDGYFVHFFAPQGMDPIPKNVLFILDISGSMSGTKIQQLKDAMLRVMDDLHEGDHFNIMKFSTGAVYWKSGVVVPATKQNIREAKVYIRDMRASGLTNINEALTFGMDFLNGLDDTEGRAPVVVFLTDGEASKGERNTDRILANVKTRNTESTPVFSLAFGRGADYEFVKKVAVQNYGVGRKIYEDSDAALQIGGFYDAISSTTLTNVTFKYLDASVETQNLTKSNFNSFFDGSEIIVAGRIDDNAVHMLRMSVNGNGLQGGVELALTTDITNQPDLTQPGDYAQITEKIWAYLTIKQLLEQSVGETDAAVKQTMKDRALELSLKYKFVTPLTSMVVTKPDEQDVGQLEEGEDADLTRQGSPPARSQSGGGGGGGGGGYGGGGGGDPHFMIRVRGMEHPICFDVPAKGGENIRLLKDRKTGITVNAGIIHSGRMNKYGQEKTFMGEVAVITKDFTLLVNSAEIQLNGALLSWETEMPLWYKGAKINVIIRQKDEHILYIDFGNDVRIMIKRFLREELGIVNYLNVYVDKEDGLSSEAGGILGQFVHKKMKIQKVHPGQKERTIGELRVSEKKDRHRVKTYLVRKPDIIKGSYEMCWSAHKKVAGLLDGKPSDYLVKDIYSL